MTTPFWRAVAVLVVAFLLYTAARWMRSRTP
jgi:hypothetical protein